MSTIVLRTVKGSPLTSNEVDTNFTNLNNDKAELVSPSFTTPALGTPTAGVLTNCTGTASGLTAGNATLAATVTTNANLTGVVTSTGNATAIADAALSIGKTSGLQTALDAKEATANKDATGGYAGLTLFKLNLKNAANTFTNFFTNTTTAARTWTMQDRNGTIADDTDLATKAALAGSASQSFSMTTAAVDTNTTQGASTAFVLAQAASANPVMDGSVAVGTSTRYARADHVHASDTTKITTSSTDTLTNKRVTARVGSTTSSATPTINTDNYDIYKLTAQTADITSFTTNLTGSPVDGDILIIEITGTAARAITWGASFEASTVALPTTTVTTAMLAVAFIWNTATSKWRCVAAV